MIPRVSKIVVLFPALGRHFPVSYFTTGSDESKQPSPSPGMESIIRMQDTATFLFFLLLFFTNSFGFGTLTMPERLSCKALFQ